MNGNGRANVSDDIRWGVAVAEPFFCQIGAGAVVVVITLAASDIVEQGCQVDGFFFKRAMVFQDENPADSSNIEGVIKSMPAKAAAPPMRAAPFRKLRRLRPSFKFMFPLSLH